MTLRTGINLSRSVNECQGTGATAHRYIEAAPTIMTNTAEQTHYFHLKNQHNSNFVRPDKSLPSDLKLK